MVEVEKYYKKGEMKMSELETNSIDSLEKQLKEARLKICILEEENSLLRENVECLLADIDNIKNERKKIEEEKKKIGEEKKKIEAIQSGKIYKILYKTKNIIKR